MKSRIGDKPDGIHLEGGVAMVILIRKKHLCAVGLFVVFLCGMTVVLWKGKEATLSVSAASLLSNAPVYVIDAGHGGEDGGAVADDGTVESNLNLELALRLNDLLRFCGQNTQMTRREDVSIYSEGASTLREKKVSDLKNRVAIVNGLDNAILVSLHQNKLPAYPGVHGAQVFYNTVEPAQELADQIQAALNTAINIDNPKSSKPISNTIYLTKNVTAPAVLIECGFLSNPTETIQLQQPEYQKKLAVTIAAGLLDHTKEENS